MELFSHETRIDFLGKRNLALMLSGIIILLSILSLAIRGLNFGIDFTGGTLVEVEYTQPAKLDIVRQALSAGGITKATVQYYGTQHDVLIRLSLHHGTTVRAELSDRILDLLKHQGEVKLRRIEFVGPQVGESLREDGGLAMVYALIGILIYVALRFEYRFSLGSVLALVHDVIITLGFFSATQFEFDLSVLAAILAVIGYSLNDTIVVFDRIRENFRKIRKRSVIEVMNLSINETLSRTILTGGTTLLVLIVLVFLGGSALYGFSLALIVGILIGTYSSIYVASTAALMLGVSRTDLATMKKEASELSDQP
jgi:preprotein translocase subunit SecF